MKTLVIYDNTGKIYLMMYGEENAPQGIPSMYVDIPEGAILERIDVTAPENPKPIFTFLPDSDIGILKREVVALQEELNTLKASTENLSNSADELTLVIADMIGGTENAE